MRDRRFASLENRSVCVFTAMFMCATIILICCILNKDELKPVRYPMPETTAQFKACNTVVKNAIKRYTV